MTLHLPTLMLVLIVGFLLMLLELAVARSAWIRSPELRIWNWGGWAILGGFVGLAARLTVPEWISILVGNGLIQIGMAIYARAIYRFVAQSEPPRWITGFTVLALIALALMLPWPLHQRTSVLSFLFIVPLVPCAWLIYQHAWHAERSLRSIAFTFSLCIVALLVRGVHAWLSPQEYTNLLQASFGQGGTFLMAFVALLGAGWGFVLAGFERTASQLEVLATHDGLTGCVNRRTADAMLSHALARGRRDGSPVALVLIDIDHFKQINDRYGHATGDEALRAFAAAVRLRLRNSDVFGRWGGEEFGLILPATDRPGAMRLAEEVRASVEALELQAPDSGTIAVRMSAGVAIAPSDSELKSATLYRLADQALYAAKHQGRNRVVLAEA
ncbi:MAG: GGDEF domain-containing protein [Vitreoscilla sp.]|nr:GGDEF domain-containing protein [Vitreoscilla sp.]